MKKNNDAWNLRHLVDESFVPSNQRTSVLYCKLSDFMSMLALQSWITIDFYEMTLVLASCHSVAKMDDFLSRMQATKQTDTWKLSVTILTENLVKLRLVKLIDEGILETKTDCSREDQLFFACVAFWVILLNQSCSAPQNDRLNFNLWKI